MATPLTGGKKSSRIELDSKIVWNRRATMDRQDVVSRLRDKQRASGIVSQAELARLLNVTEAAVSRWYSGSRKPGADAIMAMLRIWPDILNDGHGVER